MRFSKTRVLATVSIILFVLPAFTGVWHLARDDKKPVIVTQPAGAFSFEIFENTMNVTTFASPDGSKDELWHFLNSAEESIYVEIYGINNPRILDLLHSLHDAKPSLEMKFLLGEGSLGYTSQNDYVANNLTLLGYPVRWTSSTNFTYAHQKFVIIDNETTIVHSGNWAKTSFPEPDGKANREWSIAITDSDVTGFYRSVFDADWRNGTDYDAGTDGTGTALTYTYSTSTYQEPFATPGEFSGPMKVTPIVSPDTSLQGILYCINAAKYTLDIQIPYFTNVGDSGSVDQIIDAILAARARGVTVRVISEESYDWAIVEATFIEHGIPITWQDTRWFTANHNKGIIVDGKIVLVSSINYSDGSINENREAGIIIENEEVAQWFQEIYDFDWGIADGDSMNKTNLYWEPNIPSHLDEINVTVYAHRLNSSWLEEIRLGVKIDTGAWENHTITDNLFLSSEDDPENYYYVIPVQPPGTNISVRAYIYNDTVWYNGIEMVIHVPSVDVSIPEQPDVMLEDGYIGESISWQPVGTYPQSYEVFKNGTSTASGSWNTSGEVISVSLDWLTLGVWNFTLSVVDGYSNVATDTVLVTVFDDLAPVIYDSEDLTFIEGVTGMTVWWELRDAHPATYRILTDGVQTATSGWVDTLTVSIDVSDNPLGTKNYTIEVFDTSGNVARDSILVTVYDGTLPVLSHPDDISVEQGASTILSWTAHDLHPSNYYIYIDGGLANSGEWTENPQTITITIENLPTGSYNYTILIEDTSGNIAVDTVIVTVPASLTEILTAVAIGAAVIIIVAIACLKKK
ncbi:MAG: phosphatidylserine/phosphatidylglycerophosphate/cardiolipin synthase family protein, partial [Candidatus Thorarchaeota archaeon]